MDVQAGSQRDLRPRPRCGDDLQLGGRTRDGEHYGIPRFAHFPAYSRAAHAFGGGELSHGINGRAPETEDKAAAGDCGGAKVTREIVGCGRIWPCPDLALEDFEDVLGEALADR